MSRGLRIEPYHPSLHTVETLGVQLAAMTERDHTMRIAGSLGRAAFYERTGKGFDWEFAQRNQQPESKGSSRPIARDVDIIAPSQPPYDGYPFPVDYTAFCGNRGMIVEERGAWWLVAPRHDFAESISEDLMEPYEGRLNDMTFAALQPIAQLAVFSIHGNLRTRKIIEARAMFRAELEEQGIATDDTLLAPFQNLSKLNRNDILHRLRFAYRRNVPEVVRKRLTNISRLASEIIDK